VGIVHMVTIVAMVLRSVFDCGTRGGLRGFMSRLIQVVSIVFVQTKD